MSFIDDGVDLTKYKHRAYDVQNKSGVCKYPQLWVELRSLTTWYMPATGGGAVPFVVM